MMFVIYAKTKHRLGFRFSFIGMHKERAHDILIYVWNAMNTLKNDAIKDAAGNSSFAFARLVPTLAIRKQVWMRRRLC